MSSADEPSQLHLLYLLPEMVLFPPSQMSSRTEIKRECSLLYCIPSPLSCQPGLLRLLIDSGCLCTGLPLVPGPLPWTGALRFCQRSGWAGPEGAVLYTCVHRHLKIKPPAGLGAPPWLGRSAQFLAGVGRAALNLLAPGLSLSQWAVGPETEGRREVGQLLRGGPNLPGAWRIREIRRISKFSMWGSLCINKGCFCRRDAR